jgi:ABC-type proline/glycine betaine transport system permease subunit
MTPFRILVALAFVFHVIGLFLIPHLGFVVSQHWVLYALYLVPYAALLGVWFGQLWGRYLLLASIVVTAAIGFFAGISIAPPEAFLSLVTAVLDGAVLGLAFFGART